MFDSCTTLQSFCGFGFGSSEPPVAMVITDQNVHQGVNLTSSWFFSLWFYRHKSQCIILISGNQIAIAIATDDTPSV